MDIAKLDLRLVKAAYILLALLLAAGAVISALMHEQYIALGFIVAASLVLLAGAFLINYLHGLQKVKDVD